MTTYSDERGLAMGVITISRQLGSSGDEIAELVCERLGYQRFDKKTMAQIGAELGMAGAIVDRAAASTQIGPRSLIERWFGNYENPLGDPSSWTFGARSDARVGLSVVDLRKLIEAGYEKGNVIIVGRGGMAALQDKPTCCTCASWRPRRCGFKRVQQREGITEEEARQRVDWRDRTDVEWISATLTSIVTSPGSTTCSSTRGTLPCDCGRHGHRRI